MKLKFKIKSITIRTHVMDGYKMLAFGDNEDESKAENYLILKKSKYFTEEDIKLKKDNYYIEYNNTSNSGYGICKEVILDYHILTFIFDDNNNQKVESIELDYEFAEYCEIGLKGYLKDMLEKTLTVKNYFYES